MPNSPDEERAAVLEVLERVTEWVIRHYAGGPAWDDVVKKLYRRRRIVFGLVEAAPGPTRA